MERSEIKNRYSQIGIAYTVFVIVMYAVSFIIKLVMTTNDLHISSSWLNYLVGLAPIWMFGFPVCFILIKNMQHTRPEDQKLLVGFGFKFYFILTFLMITGNIVGRIIGYLLSHLLGVSIDNTTIDMISRQDILPSIIFAVILGPMLEELAFRKLLIDRLWFLSKKHTIFLSGFMFALFHTNLYQFFYAFLVGVIFAYIYTITGRIRYTIMLHMIINFVHGIVPVILIKMMDVDKLARIAVLSPESEEARKLAFELIKSPGFLLFILYLLVLLGFVITGLVLFIKNVKRMRVDDSMSPLQGTGSVSVVYKNMGMILFVISMIAFTVFEIVISQ